ncbi:endonuclease/exonuclease/phosphatase family protein [bacterium]|nr:endonuclease/exonuclease/phosphatase family protein [bacterium]
MPTFVTYNTGGLVPRREQQIQFLARNILRAGADVVCLQEVGPDLDHFLGHHLQGQFAYVARPPGNDPRDLNVAILSRQPFQQVRSHAQHRFELLDGSRLGRFSRDLLRVDLTLQGCHWSVYTTHLKSMRGGPSAHRQRESEAQAIVQLLGQQVSDHPWVLTGDLNDGRESAALQRLFGSPLLLCNSLDGTSRTLTFPCRKSRQQFDYVLFPASMRARLISSKVWPESRASDHAMVSATFA